MRDLKETKSTLQKALAKAEKGKEQMRQSYDKKLKEMKDAVTRAETSAEAGLGADVAAATMAAAEPEPGKDVAMLRAFAEKNRGGSLGWRAFKKSGGK